MKATHTGTCQVCGRGQKLPSGQLSKHGYTVEWGFFSGTCPGSNHLPFEKSKDLIDGAIAGAEREIHCLEIESADLKAGKCIGGDNSKQDKVMMHVYDPARATRTRSGYVWEEVLLRDKFGGSTRASGYEFIRTVLPVEKQKPHQTGHYAEIEPKEGETLQAAVRRFFNTLYAEGVLDTRIQMLKRYVKWQQHRISDWKPTELTPIK
jgi:hypothetical protein